MCYKVFGKKGEWGEEEEKEAEEVVINRIVEVTLVIGIEIDHRERRKCIILRESGSWRTDWSFLQNSWCCG